MSNFVFWGFVFPNFLLYSTFLSHISAQSPYSDGLQLSIIPLTSQTNLQSFLSGTHDLQKRPGARYIYPPTSFGSSGRIVYKRPGGRYYYWDEVNTDRMKRPGARYFAPFDSGELLNTRRYYTARGGYGRRYRWKRGGGRFVGPNNWQSYYRPQQFTNLARMIHKI